jgi:hypothetical protein
MDMAKLIVSTLRFVRVEEVGEIVFNETPSSLSEATISGRRVARRGRN